jgi:DNA-directed RNA polymerase beta' subunit
MKTRMDKNGTYYGKVMIGRTPAGKPVFKKIFAKSPVELWKQHYLLKNSMRTLSEEREADDAI